MMACKKKKGLRFMVHAVLWILFGAMVPFTIVSWIDIDDYRADIVSQFQMQYLIGWCLLLCLAVLARRVYLSVLTGVCLLLIAYQVLFIPNDKKPLEGRERYTILSFNLYMGNRNADGLLDYLETQEADLLFLIETARHWRAIIEPLKKRYPYHLIRYGWVENGVALYSKYPLRAIDSSVAQAVAEVALPEGKIVLLGCHPRAPRTQQNFLSRNRYYAGVAELAQQQRLPLLVLGDFNSAPWTPAFKHFLDTSGLNLITTEVVQLPTWPVYNPLLWVPIDHFLYKGGIRVLKQARGAPMGSDHYPIALEFQIEQEHSD